MKPDIGQIKADTALCLICMADILDCIHLIRIPVHTVHAFANRGFCAVKRFSDSSFIGMQNISIQHDSFGRLIFQCLFEPVIGKQQTLLFTPHIVAGNSIPVIQLLRIKCAYRMTAAKKQYISTVFIQSVKIRVGRCCRPFIGIVILWCQKFFCDSDAQQCYHQKKNKSYKYFHFFHHSEPSIYKGLRIESVSIGSKYHNKDHHADINCPSDENTVLQYSVANHNTLFLECRYNCQANYGTHQ